MIKGSYILVEFNQALLIKYMFKQFTDEFGFALEKLISREMLN